MLGVLCASVRQYSCNVMHTMFNLKELNLIYMIKLSVTFNETFVTIFNTQVHTYSDMVLVHIKFTHRLKNNILQ